MTCYSRLATALCRGLSARATAVFVDNHLHVNLSPWHALMAVRATQFPGRLHDLQLYSTTAHGSGGDPCSGSGSGSSSSSGPGTKSSSIAPSSDAVGFDKMLEVMMQSPTVMKLMMSRMPEHMRRPEVLQAMLANPDVRARMSALAKQSGLTSIMQNLDMSKVSEGMSATLQAGLDPAQLIERFQQSPSLARAMQNPRVMAALMDMASNGADALKKYEGDKDVIEAAMEAGDILQELQQSKAGTHSDSSSSSTSSSTSSSSSSSSMDSSTSSMSSMEQQLGVPPQELMQRLMSRPDLLAKVQDPEVQKALMEVSQSPWKLVKYVFNKKVMSALKDMKDVVQPGKS